MRRAKTVLVLSLFILASLAVQVRAADKLDGLGREAVRTALNRLQASPDSPGLACLTNAGYSIPGGQSTRFLYDVIASEAAISLGRGNLLPVHTGADDGLWFAFVQKKGEHELNMVYEILAEDGTLKTEGPLNVYVDQGRDFADFKTVLGPRAFALVTLANGWADGQPEDLLQGALYHDHFCCGVATGYLTARYILGQIPLAEGEKYIYVGAPGWCQDDYLMYYFNLTPGKHGYFIMDYPWSRPWKTAEATYEGLGGVIIKYDRKKQAGKAYVLRFDWRFEDFKKFLGQPDLKIDWGGKPWLHVLYNRFFLQNMAHPEMFVSVIKTLDIQGQEGLKKLTGLGANPLREILGEDPTW